MSFTPSLKYYIYYTNNQTYKGIGFEYVKRYPQQSYFDHRHIYLFISLFSNKFTLFKVLVSGVSLTLC